MIKKILFTTGVIFLFGSLLWSVEAQNPDDLVVDPKCSVYTAAQVPGVNDSPICNTVCFWRCVRAGQSCPFNEPGSCEDIDFEGLVPEVKDTIVPASNPFDIELCPDPATRPPDDPYCTLSLVRLGVYFAISVVVFVTAIIGARVVWERSTATDNPDKIEKAVKLARDAVIGLLIALFFLAIVQVISMLIGLTGSIFEFSIVPVPRTGHRGDPCRGVGYIVCDASQGLVCGDSNGDGVYMCESP